MLCDLLSVETSDHVVLHGAFYEGDINKPAVLIMHGAAMNFYTGMGRFLPAIINSQGYACLSANNRGHDFGTAPDSDKKPVLGLMRDRFKDCMLDVDAWIDFLHKKGYSRIILLGHSQAVSKLLYAQNTQQYPGVAGLILVSPPPSAAEMMRYLVKENFYESGLFKAQELADLNGEHHLIVLRGRGTMPWIFTPQTFLSFYGPDTPADTEELIKKVYCPMLLIRGSEDFDPISRDLLADIKNNAGRSDECMIVEIEGADHFYSQYEQVLGEVISKWLNELKVQ